MMLPEQETLKALRALHLPAEGVPDVSDLLLALAAGLAAALIVKELWAWVQRHRRPVRKAALDALIASRPLPTEERLVSQARILRQVVKAIEGDEAARLQGQAWLRQLDQVFRTGFFTSGEGRHYVETLYRPEPHPDLRTMDGELESLINSIRR